MSNFLSNIKQRVVLNGQTSSLVKISSPRTILGPLLPLIYKNDLTHGLASNTKLFTDNTSLFSVAHNISASAKELNEEWNKIDN